MPSHPVPRFFLCPKTGTFRNLKVGYCGSLDIRPCGLRHGVSVGGTLCLRLFFCANGCAGDKVEIPITAVRESLPKRRKSAEKVENPVAVICESLPKSGESAEKGRDSQSRRLEISTQKVENPGKR